MKKMWLIGAVIAELFLLPMTAQAADYVLTIKDQAFSPAELTVPADQKVKIIVKNLDTTPAEFESHKLNREKVIAGNSEANVFVGPLKAGSYPFFEEFHGAKGTLIAK